jgi:membrane protease YdiL (CAAX protease family)
MLRNIGFAILKIAGYVLLATALSAAVIVPVAQTTGPAFARTVGFQMIGDGALASAAIVAAVILARFMDKRSLATIGFAPRRFVDLLSGTIVGALILAVPIGVLLAMGAARYAPDFESFSATSLAVALVACLINVIAQEALFRSYIFQELWAKFGAWVATMVTTLLFVAAHWGAITEGTAGLVAAANILLASLLLSLAYVRTASLWLPIGIHLGWNGMQGPVLGINVTGHDLSGGHWSVFAFPGDALWTGGAMGVEGGLAGLVGPALGIALVALLFKQQPKPDFTPRPK